MNKAILGTKFCTRLASTWNSDLDYPDLEPTDLVKLDSFDLLD